MADLCTNQTQLKKQGTVQDDPCKTKPLKGQCHKIFCLKVPKRENFSLAFFALNEPIWVCDLGTGEKIEFFIN